MFEREDIIVEFMQRLSSITGVQYTARNPDKVPSKDEMPCIQLFEMEDKVEETKMRGDVPIAYRRAFEVITEHFIKGTTDEKASKELIAFLKLCKQKIYADGQTLGKRCSLEETGAGRILRPESGSHIAGMGISWKIRYVETIN
jgi:hypothetical protein